MVWIFHLFSSNSCWLLFPFIFSSVSSSTCCVLVSYLLCRYFVSDISITVIWYHWLWQWLCCFHSTSTWIRWHLKFSQFDTSSSTESVQGFFPLSVDCLVANVAAILGSVRWYRRKFQWNTIKIRFRHSLLSGRMIWMVFRPFRILLVRHTWRQRWHCF